MCDSKAHFHVFLVPLGFTCDYFLFLASELGDLVESIHVIVGLMENLQGRGTLRVCNYLDIKL